jgi:hypothetical protein
MFHHAADAPGEVRRIHTNEVQPTIVVDTDLSELTVTGPNLKHVTVRFTGGACRVGTMNVHAPSLSVEGPALWVGRAPGWASTEGCPVPPPMTGPPNASWE